MDTLLTVRRRSLLRAAGAMGAVGSVGALGTLTLAGCGDARRGATPQGQHFSGQTMGSAFNVRLAGEPHSKSQLESLQAAVQAALDSVEKRMSLYRADSELVRFNQHPSGEAFAFSPAMMAVLQAGQTVAELSEGAFDMTVAPLVMAWGFGPGPRAGEQSLPPAVLLQSGRAALGHRALQLDTHQAQGLKLRQGLQLDLGGIAKGYGVDRAAQALLDQGARHFMVEVGGEVRTAGLNGRGLPWQIGIEQPDAMPQRARIVVPLSGRAMATSGDYRQFFELDGRRYCHEIDPRSGEPTAHALASVSVVADDCLHADALATALFVMGPERGPALAAREGIAAHFIVRTADGRLLDRSSAAFAALQAGHRA